MDIFEVIGILEALKEDKRKHWVHPLFKKRLSIGQFHTLYPELRKHPEKFYDYFNMTSHTFDELLKSITQYIAKNNITRDTLCPEERLTITLRFLSSGLSYRKIAQEFLVGKSTVSKIISETACIIWDILQPQEMPEPSEELWLEIAKRYYKKTNYPNCIGSIDGKHIRIRKPPKSGSNYFNYKKFFSIVLLAVADANCSFIAIDVGACGRNADSNIFKESGFGKKLACGSLKIPNSTKLPNSNGLPQPFVFLGDEAFGLQKHILRPFPNKSLNKEERIYNYRHSRARRCVECAFGILTSKWRVLHTPIATNVNTTIAIVKAVCILHNFVIAREQAQYAHISRRTSTTLTSSRSQIITVSNSGKTTRENFKNYFLNEGKLSWQEKYL
ncbi:uncharacterized protein LOC128198369 [Bicyclus anynana]|uniref:Uncharacterized protein LOC128198369 n=1 Tax=Bicyclus anynana TaxID=110368 RepID=A0ABM3LK31_BICAN|nr:uncharacterized protein LOC128198369 [Bicyclus anynana]